jgi:hypothetical protein
MTSVSVVPKGLHVGRRQTANESLATRSVVSIQARTNLASLDLDHTCARLAARVVATEAGLVVLQMVRTVHGSAIRI